MGLGPADLKLYLELRARGVLAGLRSVADLGSQEIMTTTADFEAILETAGISEYSKGDFKNLEKFPGHPRCPARAFYALLGLDDYTCFDLNGEHDARRLDLNAPLEEPGLLGRFDLVTDHGMNEHMFNVAEAYRTMHRLCRPRGLLVAHQACYRGNGYYMFDVSFFESLAQANGYSILYSSYVVRTQTGGEFHLPPSTDLMNTLDWAKVAYAGVCYVFQKTSDADFRRPYESAYQHDRLGCFGYRLQYNGEHPGRTYLPITRSGLEKVPGKELARQLLSRGLQRLGLKS